MEPASSKPITHFSYLGLRIRLLLFLMVTVIPTLGLILYSGFKYQELAKNKAAENLLQLTKIGSIQEDLFIEESHQLLLALSKVPALKEPNISECDDFLAKLLTRNRLYANLGLANPKGEVICSGLPTTVKVSIADRNYFKDAIKTKTFSIGEYQIGRITKKASINFGLPIFDNSGKITSVVFSAVDLSKLNKTAPLPESPEDSVFMIVDRNATILVRYPDPEEWVGKKLSDEPVVKAISVKTSGSLETTGLDHVKRLYAYTPLGSQDKPGAYLALGIPVKIIYADSKNLLLTNLLIFIIVTIFALIAGLIVGEFLIFSKLDTVDSFLRGSKPITKQ